MKQILLIDESKLFRNYLTEVLEGVQLKVIQSRNGSAGLLKLKKELPDLIIIDYHLSHISFSDFYVEKMRNPQTAGVPIIIVSSRLDEKSLKSLSSYAIEDIFTKPLSLDNFLLKISKILRVKIKIDTTPCIIEAHFNENILFIQISEGLNHDKISLLRFKISELLDLYQVNSPQILILMAGCTFITGDQVKLDILFNIILDTCKTLVKNIKIITKSSFIVDYFNNHSNYNIRKIEILGSLDKALEALTKTSSINIHATEKFKTVISPSIPKKDGKEAIRLDFNMNRLKDQIKGDNEKVCLAVVDDDIVIRNLIINAFSQLNWKIRAYGDGQDFIDEPNIKNFDLIFLDLLMPKLDGFSVLQELKRQKIQIPVIVLSMLNNRQLVVKAIQLGVTGYLIKPIKPGRLILKALEMLKSNIM